MRDLIEASSILRTTLYDARFEHDACGVGGVAALRGAASRAVVTQALTVLENLHHRGATLGDDTTGDGAGILLQIPHAIFADWLHRRRADRYAQPGDYAVAVCFLPYTTSAESGSVIEQAVRAAGLPTIGWREIPTDQAILGYEARATMPALAQLIVGRPAALDAAEFERACYRARKAAESALVEAELRGYLASFSSRTIVYKGMLTGRQLGRFFLDLHDHRCASQVAVTHTRFSTNTFPSWERAQPFRLLCHNGEINTLQGNVNWIKAREAGLPPALWPVIDEQGSDSAMLDNLLDLLVYGGRDLRHAVAMLVPEAWEGNPLLPAAVRAFYEYHAALIEPWDGPAGLCFTDGQILGAALDRNGLRPLRYNLTAAGLLVIASEAGADSLDPSEIVEHGRLGPGEMLAADVRDGTLWRNHTLKHWLAERKPYSRLSGECRVLTQPLEAQSSKLITHHSSLTALQRAFGYTSEELQVVLKPMVWEGHEPIGSMGDDTPHAILSELPRPLAHYFKQRFAEVTNPPIDPLRETSFMSLRVHLGPWPALLESEPRVDRLVLESPFITPAMLTTIEAHRPGFRLDATFPVDGDDGIGGRGDVPALERTLARLHNEAEAAIHRGVELLVLDDSATGPDRMPVPSLLAVASLHHHLIRKGLRARCALIAFSGEARDTHSLAALIGYGANAVCPWLALETAAAIGAEDYRGESLTATEAHKNLLHAAEAGLLKIMSKMGIATAESYCGAQIFEAIGLSHALVERHFTGTPSRVGGIGLAEIEAETRCWHAAAFESEAVTVAHERAIAGLAQRRDSRRREKYQNGDAPDGRPVAAVELPSPGFYKYKKAGEHHSWSPQVVQALHKAVRTPGSLNGRFDEGFHAYKHYAEMVDHGPAAEPRDLLRVRGLDRPDPDIIPLDVGEVEPGRELLRRFSTAAMSHGSISAEAHETLAIAMNRLGGASNSGEGGEDPGRFGTARNSKIKQVASARFGVTPAYLISAEELQIKMAQGSKPGEGGQLPGHKVTVEIAALRRSAPGITLISPPPHHDIYSIEDLAQLIYDLRQINPRAAISVKLVAQAGVGTIAAGVAKAGADIILISGDSGGTGASPLSSIKHAGIPWELGLAETHQTLVANRLRGRVRLRTDGGLRTGRDILVAALLGADEFSFGTAALIAEGCVMARACHNNTCPVGIATQREELRRKFDGTPEQVVAFFTYLAEELRELLARLGAHSLDEIIGRTDLLYPVARGRRQLDFHALLAEVPVAGPRHHRPGDDAAHHLPTVDALGATLTREVLDDLARDGRSQRRVRIRNVDRTVGARLSGALACQYGEKGLPDGTVRISLDGVAGQSFGAFLLPGIELDLDGLANDYVGKGLAGGTISLRPPEQAAWRRRRRGRGPAPVLGNVALFGAIGGRLFAAGSAGERFAVRNSGATAVVEGVGAHGCEYMTGGTVAILGPVGRNFGAGMTGGRAFVYDPDDRLATVLNPQLVRISTLTPEDEADLYNLVAEHARRTASPVARRLLAAWSATLPEFKLVVPR